MPSTNNLSEPTTTTTDFRVSLTPVRIASGEVQLSALLYAPAAKAETNPTSETATSTAGRILVGCLPLAEERKGSVRPLSELARVFAKQGWRVLLFDYAGTGDSPGDFSATTWSSLCADTTAAVQFARNLPRAREVSLLGVRLGARLALAVATNFTSASPPAIVSLCLWEPVLDGKAWLREMRRRSRFRQGGASRAAPENDLDGYLYSDSLLTTLAGMDAASDDELFLSRKTTTPTPSEEPPKKMATETATTRPPTVHLITLTAGTQVTAGMQKIATRLGVSPHVVKLPSFWLENAVMNYDSLIAQTRTCLLGENNGE